MINSAAMGGGNMELNIQIEQKFSIKNFIKYYWDCQESTIIQVQINDNFPWKFYSAQLNVKICWKFYSLTLNKFHKIQFVKHNAAEENI